MFSWEKFVGYLSVTRGIMGSCLSQEFELHRSIPYDTEDSVNAIVGQNSLFRPMIYGIVTRRTYFLFALSHKPS